MNTKKAKTTFLFNVFLASVAAEPLEIAYREIAVILNISESTLSKMRHSRTKKMPASLHPELMAARFAAEIVKEFAPTRSAALLFAEYARLLGDRYILSDSLARFAALVAAGSPMEEDRAKKLFAGMIPELLKRCYEEAYANSEQEYANWVIKHSDLRSETIYQKLCDTINQDLLSSEQLKQLLNIVYAAGVRHQLAHYHSDFSYLEMINNFFRSQVNQPFYSSIRRSERISISDDSAELVRAVSAREQIVPQTLQPVDFALTQTFYPSLQMPPEELVKAAFAGLSCTVNGQPLLQYVNQHENAAYTSARQLITSAQAEGSEDAAADLTLRFSLYPAEAGEPVNVEYGYTCTMPFIRNLSCNDCYTLPYSCKFLDHEISLDERTRRNWGVRVKTFAPVTNSVRDETRPSGSAQISGTADSRHVMFYDWVLPGAGYFCNLYELNGAENRTSA